MSYCSDRLVARGPREKRPGYPVMLFPLAIAAAVMAGCAAKEPPPVAEPPPPPVVQEVAPEPPPPPAARRPTRPRMKPPLPRAKPEQVAPPPLRERLKGISLQDARVLLGPAAEVEEKAPARILLYRVPSCSLRIAFFPQVQTLGYQALTVEMTGPSDEKEQARCERELLAAGGGPDA